MKGTSDIFRDKASRIKLLLTDCDGVLTDTGVYYGDEGEVLKRFSIRDGMGVERLRTLCSIETAIISGERSASLKKRGEKLQIREMHLGIKDKPAHFDGILERMGITADQVAYIGDDTNDLGMMKLVGLTACPSDAMVFVKDIVDYICDERGGFGAFREFAEQIIRAQLENKELH